MADHPLQPHYDEIKKMIASGATNAQIAGEFDTSEASVRRFRSRKGNEELKAPPQEPAFKTDGDTAEINSRRLPKDQLPSPEVLMRHHHLDPEDWEAPKAVVSWWGDIDNPMYQMKLFLNRKKPLEFIFPGRLPKDLPALPKAKAQTDAPRLIFVCGDLQAPHYNKDQEDCWLQLLEIAKPDMMVDIGDQGDNPDAGNYDENTKWNVPLNDCIQSVTEINYYRRMAHPAMKMVGLIGNHDVRVENLAKNKAKSIYGIKKGDIPEAENGYRGSVLDWAYLTGCHELNIDIVALDGDEYFHAEVDLAEGAKAEHGKATGPNAALKTIENLTHTVFFGHTHTQEIRSKTIWNQDGSHKVIYSVNIGGGFDITSGGFGFVKKPNWQPGGAALVDHGDGNYVPELIRYNAETKKMMWRDVIVESRL